MALLFSQNSHAQVKSSNNDIWFHLVNKNMITKKLSVSFEATIRYANGFSENSNGLLDHQLITNSLKSLWEASVILIITRIPMVIRR